MAIRLQQLLDGDLSEQYVTEDDVRALIVEIGTSSILSRAERRQLDDLLAKEAARFQGKAAHMLRVFLGQSAVLPNVMLPDPTGSEKPKT